MRCSSLCMVLAACLTAGAAQAETVYDADFSTPGIGSTHTSGGDPLESSPIAGPNWTMSWPSPPASDTTTNSFITQGNTVFIDDWGGDGVLTSDAIDVSSYDLVDIAGVAATHGNDVFNNTSTEYFDWFYSIDAGSQVNQLFTNDGSLDHTFSNVDVSGASSLVVGFSFNVNGAGDGVDVSSLTVSGQPTAIPEPATAVLGGLTLVAASLYRRRR